MEQSIFANVVVLTSQQIDFRSLSVTKERTKGSDGQCSPLIPTLGRQRQVDFCELEVSQDYMARLYFKKQTNKQKNKEGAADLPWPALSSISGGSPKLPQAASCTHMRQAIQVTSNNILKTLNKIIIVVVGKGFIF
jgi:hypothetical protein